MPRRIGTRDRDTPSGVCLSPNSNGATIVDGHPFGTFHLLGRKPDAVSSGNPQISDVGAGAGIHARQTLEGARGSRGRAQARDQPPAPRRENRDGLSRLWTAAFGTDLRG